MSKSLSPFIPDGKIMYKIRYEDSEGKPVGGEVPRDLSGYYTTEKEALNAIKVRKASLLAQAAIKKRKVKRDTSTAKQGD